MGFYKPHKIPLNGQQDLTSILKKFWKISPIALSRWRVWFQTLPEISAPPHWPCDRSSYTIISFCHSQHCTYGRVITCKMPFFILFEFKKKGKYGHSKVCMLNKMIRILIKSWEEWIFVKNCELFVNKGKFTILV